MIRVSDALPCLVIAAALLMAGAAAAQPAAELLGHSEQEKETARALYKLGNERYSRGDYAGALDAFLGAHRIIQAPTTGLGLAKAEIELGLLLAARRTLAFVADYPRADGEPESFTRARTEGRSLLSVLQTEIPTIELRIRDGERPVQAAQVTLNGRLLSDADLARSHELDPGTHVVQVSAPGYVPTALSVELARRESQVLHVSLAEIPKPPAPPPAPVPRPDFVDRPGLPAQSNPGSSLMVAGFSVAGVALIAGATTGGLSLAAAADLEERCDPDMTCPPSAEGLRDRSLTMAHISTTSFVLAGVAAAVGVAGLVIDLQKPEPLGLRIGLGTLAIEGTL
jgi:hypothetical protein